MAMNFGDDGQLVGRFGNTPLKLGRVPYDSVESATMVAKESIVYSHIYLRMAESLVPIDQRHYAVISVLSQMAKSEREDIVDSYGGYRGSQLVARVTAIIEGGEL